MPLPFSPACLGIAQGGMPHRSPSQALALLTRTTPQVLAWPQLPQRSFREQPYVQAAAGFPGLVYDGVEERVYVERALLERELDHLSLAYLRGDTSLGVLEADDAAGLSELLRTVGPSFKGQALKGQLLGPISLGVQLTDEQQRPLIYDPMLLEAVAQHLHLRALWQEQQLAEFARATVICIDEPFLESVGSPFSPLDWEDALTLIERVFEGIGSLHALATNGAVPWKLVLETSVELVMVDACNERDPLAAADVQAFLQRGGAVAWGIVPADEDALANAQADSLVTRLEGMFDRLAADGIKRETLPVSAFITTSGSLALLSTSAAERAMGLVAEVSTTMRAKYQL